MYVGILLTSASIIITFGKDRIDFGIDRIKGNFNLFENYIVFHLAGI